MGFAMGAASGAVKGYIDVKAKTVSSKENTTKPKAEPTTQQNTTAGNKTPVTVSTEPLPDLGKFPAGHVNTEKPLPTGTPNSKHRYTAPNAKPIQNTIYNVDGKASYQVDFKFHGQGTPHGHTIPIPGNLNSGHQGNHVPFMLVPKNFW